MVPLMRPEQAAHVLREQRTASELVKRIRKLRWMGMEEEAQQLQIALCQLRQADSVLAAPPDTD
jgi:hypothetical protein